MSRLQPILIECQKGCRKAQETFFNLFAGKMFNICLRYVKNKQVAEELTDNSFVKFFRNLKNFKFTSDAETEAYFRKIVINECLQHLRKNRASFLVPVDDHDIVVNIDEEILANISAKEIYLLITKLPPDYSDVFNLFVLEKMSHSEISVILNRSEQACRCLLSRAKQMLRTMLIQKDFNHENRKIAGDI